MLEVQNKPKDKKAEQSNVIREMLDAEPLVTRLWDREICPISLFVGRSEKYSHDCMTVSIVVNTSDGHNKHA